MRQVLLGASRAAILAALLLRPEDEVHVRVGSHHRRFTGNAAPGIARAVRTRVAHTARSWAPALYSANRASAMFPELAGLLRKTAGLADLLRAALAPLQDRIRLAFVYGSKATGAAAANSDVDVMVLGPATFSEVVKALHPAQDAIGPRGEPDRHVSRRVQAQARQA